MATPMNDREILELIRQWIISEKAMVNSGWSKGGYEDLVNDILSMMRTEGKVSL